MKFTHLFILVLIVNAKAFIFSEDQCQAFSQRCWHRCYQQQLLHQEQCISAIGFTSTGIAGGSMAAAAQASIGNVVAGSLFSSLQSAAMIGMSQILTPAYRRHRSKCLCFNIYVYDCYASFKHYSNSDPGFKDSVDKKVKQAEKKEQYKVQEEKTNKQGENPIQQEQKQNFYQDPSN